jgi:chromosome partitioning protein
MKSLPEQYPELLQSSIPYASDIERMGIERMPLGAFMKNSRSVQAYHALWNEIMQRFNKAQP